MFKVSQLNFVKAACLAIFIDLQAKFSAFRGQYIWLFAEIFIPITLLLLVDKTGGAKTVILAIFPATYIVNYIFSYSWRMRANLSRNAFTTTQLVVGFHLLALLLVILIFLASSLTYGFSTILALLGLLGYVLCSPFIIVMSVLIKKYKIEFADYKAFGSYFLLGVNFAVVPFASQITEIATHYAVLFSTPVFLGLLVIISKPNTVNFRLDFARVRTNQFVYTNYVSSLLNCSAGEVQASLSDEPYKPSALWSGASISSFITTNVNNGVIPLCSPLPRDMVFEKIIEKNRRRLYTYRQIFSEVQIQPIAINWEQPETQIGIEECHITQQGRMFVMSLKLNLLLSNVKEIRIGLFNNERRFLARNETAEMGVVEHDAPFKISFPCDQFSNVLLAKIHVVSKSNDTQVKYANVAKLQF